jgi:hypothetical protein
MAIKIDLKRKFQYTPSLTEVQTRIGVGYEALQPLMPYFEPKRVETWLYAPIEQLGGKKVSEDNVQVGSARELESTISKVLKSKLKEFELYSNSIFRIYGNWQIEQDKLEGFVSINNARPWRNSYGDIDIDAYPTEKYDDLMDVIWKDDAEPKTDIVDSVFNNFIKRYSTHNLGYQEILGLEWLCFSEGVPSRYDVTTMKAVYYPTVKSYISDMFGTFKNYQERIQESLQLRYIVNKSYRNKAFKRGVSRLLDNFKISRREHASVMLIGQEPDSFDELYREFKADYLNPLFRELPQDKEVDLAIKNTIAKNKKLFPRDVKLEDFLLEDKAEEDEAPDDK